MTPEQQNWKWWFGNNDEWYSTPCRTREDAVAEALANDGGYICEALDHAPLKISAYFDAFLFMEQADDAAYDDHRNHERDELVFDATKDQIDDLQVMVRAALDQWQEKHGLVFTSQLFKATRNREYISATEATE